MKSSTDDNRRRTRQITPSTNGSFCSVSMMSKDEKTKDAFVNGSKFINCIESDLFKRNMESYFVVNEQASKINFRCMKVLQRQNKLHEKMFEINKEIDKQQNDEALASITLLKLHESVGKNEVQVRQYESLVEELEKSVEVEEDEKNYMKIEVKRCEKLRMELELINQQHLKLDFVIDRLRMKIVDSKYEKQNTLKLYNRGLMLEIGLKNVKDDINEHKIRNHELKTKTMSRESDVAKATQANKLLETGLFTYDSKISEMHYEIKELTKSFHTIVNQNESRKQWLKEYKQKIESKEALNRVNSKIISSKQLEMIKAKEILSEASMSVDCKEARLEIEENSLRGLEKAFSHKLTTLTSKHSKKHRCK